MMPKYTIKKGMVLNLQTSSKKAKEGKLIKRYEGGSSVELTEAQAFSHADILEKPPEPKPEK
jgi:hypothetical protein